MIEILYITLTASILLVLLIDYPKLLISGESCPIKKTLNYIHNYKLLTRTVFYFILSFNLLLFITLITPIFFIFCSLLLLILVSKIKIINNANLTPRTEYEYLENNRSFYV